MSSKDESPKRQPYEIGSVDADGNWQRAPAFQGIINAMECIPYSAARPDEIQAAAFNIASAAMWGGLHDQPNLQQNRGGTAADVREMINVHDLCFKLAHSLYQLHRGSREALEKGDQRGLRQFQREVAKWSDRAAEAWSELDAGEHHPSRRGAPNKDIEAAIRRAALREFDRLIDGSVKPRHPDYKAFKEFFYLLFEALNFDPKNAESQARQAVKERDDNPDKNSK